MYASSTMRCVRANGANKDCLRHNPGVGIAWDTHYNIHSLKKKRLLYLGMKYLFGDSSYSICLWGLKAGRQDLWFFYLLYALFFNVYFGKFMMPFIDIGEIDCMSIDNVIGW